MENVALPSDFDAIARALASDEDLRFAMHLLADTDEPAPTTMGEAFAGFCSRS